MIGFMRRLAVMFAVSLSLVLGTAAFAFADEGVGDNYDATHGEYAVTENAKYVAIGDLALDSSVDFDTYAELLATSIEVYANEQGIDFDASSFSDFQVLGGYSMLTADILEMVKTPEWRAVIQGADLVTVGMGTEDLTTGVNDKLVAILKTYVNCATQNKGYEPITQDWVSFGDAINVETVHQSLTEIEAVLAEQMGNPSLAAVFADVLELYSYAFACYLVDCCDVVDGVRDANPDAQIVIVGLNNIFDGLIVDLNGTQIDLGAYCTQIVDISDARYLNYVNGLEGGNVTFVSVPNAGSDAVEALTEALPVLMGGVPSKGKPAEYIAFLTTMSEIYSLFSDDSRMGEWLPNEAGHQYIYNQISSALTLTIPSEEPDPEPGTGGNPGDQPENESIFVTRIWGDYARDTAAAISEEAFSSGEGCEWVVIARDDDFRDAMSATGLAGALDAPILLTSRYGLSEVAAEEIERLGATRAYIIGGKGAMPGDLESELAAIGCKAEPRVYGDASYDTSVRCAELIAALNEADGVEAAPVVVAYGQNFQDALSMSSFAYSQRAPIFLQTFGDTAAKRGLTQEAVSLINSEFADSRIFVAGGAGAVSNASVAAIGFSEASGDVRLWGNDGYETSLAIAEHMVENGYLDPGVVVVASGAQAPKGLDALAGAALAGKHRGVMLLANGQEDLGSLDTSAVDAFLGAYGDEVRSAYILGGPYVMPSNIEVLFSGVLTAHFIDVGQGDSVFIELPNGETVLIDAGTDEAGDGVVDYIQDLGYSSIDYVLATHPHEDHIGGMPEVFAAFDVEEAWAPEVAHTTSSFESFLDAVDEEGLVLEFASAGDVMFEGKGFEGVVLSPGTGDYSDLNDWSVVLSVKFDDESILLTGDASAEVLESSVFDEHDVLKVGHHGSETSTTASFIRRVNPSVAVISCGHGNSYGHPDLSTIETLAAVDVYRTDLDGTTVVRLVSGSIYVETLGASNNNESLEPGSPGGSGDLPSDEGEGNLGEGDDPASPGAYVYIAASGDGKKYHSKPSCSNMNGAVKITLEEAEAQGKTPCKKCY